MLLDCLAYVWLSGVGWGGVTTYMLRCFNVLLHLPTYVMLCCFNVLLHFPTYVMLRCFNVLLHFPTYAMRLSMFLLVPSTMFGKWSKKRCQIPWQPKMLNSQTAWIKKNWQHIWAWQWRWENSTCHDLSQLTASTYFKNLKWRNKWRAAVALSKTTPKWDPQIWRKNRNQSTWKWHKMLVFVGRNETSKFRPN